MLVIPEKRRLIISTDVYAAIAKAIPHAKLFMHEGETTHRAEPWA